MIQIPHSAESADAPKADNDTAPTMLSDTELERQLLALAEEYAREVSQPNLNTEELIAIDKKWQEKFTELGIRSTNNMHVWFTDNGGPYNAYNIHTETPDPAVVYLQELATNEPDFFEECATAQRTNSKLFTEWLKKTGGMGPQTVDHTIARWTLDLKMTEAFNKMLTYPGATEEILDQLSI
jgi:hypothetical protein